MVYLLWKTSPHDALVYSDEGLKVALTFPSWTAANNHGKANIGVNKYKVIKVIDAATQGQAEPKE